MFGWSPRPPWRGLALAPRVALTSALRRVALTSALRRVALASALRRVALASVLTMLVPTAALAGDVSVSGLVALRERAEPLAPVIAVLTERAIVFAHSSEDGWVRVTTRNGETGFVPGVLEGQALVTDERAAVGQGSLPARVRLAADSAIKASPAAGSRVVATSRAGSVLRVISRLGDWAMLETEDGSRGWIDLVVSPVSAGAASAAPPALAEGAPARPRLPAPTTERPLNPAPAEPASTDAAPNRDVDREAAREAARAEREAARAAARAEREAREASEAAAKSAARQAEASGEAPASKAAESSDAAEAEKAAARAEAAAAAEARRAEREAAAAARKAEREAAAAARAAAQPEPKAEPKPEPDAEPAIARDDSADQRRAAEAEARRLKEEEAAERRRADEAARAAKDAERAARAEEEKQEKARLAEQLRQAEAAAAVRGPATPADIPPAVAVPMEAKAPSERKRDPSTNPLVRQGVPQAGGQAPMPALPPGAGERFDEEKQLERSVAALHDDRGSALGLSTGEGTATPAPSVYVREDARPVQTSVVSQIVVRVNDEILTNADFERGAQEMLEEVKRRTGGSIGVAEEREVRRRLLAKMIDQLVLLEEGKVLGVQFDKVYEAEKSRFMKQAGIKDDLELVQILEATGRTWDDFRRDLLRESIPPYVLQNQVYRGITVSEDDIESHYRMRQEDWAEEGCVRIREIVLQPEPRERTRDFNVRLESLLKSLESGADFCELARRHSKAPSADDCGLLPACFTRSQLDEKVALVAFRMKPGDVEPITTQWGFHVIRLEEAKARRVRPLEEVRDKIVDRLRGERGAEAMRRYVDRLRESTKVDVAPEYRALLEGPARAGSAGQ